MFDERIDWKRDITVSLIFHVAIAAAILGISWARFQGDGNQWGGTQAGEGAINATLVSAAPTIPLPAPKQPTENIVANESKGLAQPEPTPKVPPTPEPKAIEIPDKVAKTKPAPPIAPKPTPIQPAKPQPENVVPYGQGGPVKANMAISTAIGGGAINVGGGDFGSRYAWFVEGVRRKVSENWYQYQVDPHTASGRRVFLSFDINRIGEPTNVHVEQASGVPSLDYSAVNALKRIDTFGPLPGDYRGSYVSVQFYFDYKR